VPGGRYRSVAERVLSYTAVGFVVGHPRASEEEYAGRAHAKNSGPPCAIGGRLEKSTALTLFRHSSTRELQMLHTSGPFQKLEESKVPAGEAATQWW
jgi:hypothetical protein